jgi:integrase
MASITKIKNRNGTTSYRVAWRVGDGQRRQEYKSFDREEDARKYRSTVETDIESKRVGGPKQQTVHGYLDGWIKGIERRAERGDLSPSTLEGYRRNVGIAKRTIKDQRLSRLNQSTRAMTRCWIAA